MWHAFSTHSHLSAMTLLLTSGVCFHTVQCRKIELLRVTVSVLRKSLKNICWRRLNLCLTAFIVLDLEWQVSYQLYMLYGLVWPEYVWYAVSFYRDDLVSVWLITEALAALYLWDILEVETHLVCPWIFCFTPQSHTRLMCRCRRPFVWPQVMAEIVWDHLAVLLSACTFCPGRPLG